MKKIFEFTIILIIFSLLLCCGWSEGQTFSDKPIARLGRGTLNNIFYSPDGKLLALTGSLGVWLYDASNLEEVGLLEGVRFVAFSPDGTTLVSRGGGEVQLWDVAGPREIAVIHDANPLVLSSDGKMLTSRGSDGTVRLWDVMGQREIAVLKGHDGEVSSIAFGPDGKILASGGKDRTVRLWDVFEQKEIAILHDASSVVFSPDGKILASRGRDWTVHLWDVFGQKEIAVLQDMYSFAFSPDGKNLALGGRNGVSLWDVEKKEIVLLGGHTEGVFSTAFSPDGKILASGVGWENPTIRLWDVVEQKEIAALKGHTWSVWSVLFNPDGKTLVSKGEDRTVRLWDVAGKKEIAVIRGHANPVSTIVFSPDGKMIASGHRDGDGVHLWDIAGQKEIAAFGRAFYGVASVEFSPGGKILAIAESTDTNLFQCSLWDVAEQKDITLLKGYTNFAFSPDGNTLALVGGWGDSTVRLWDIVKQKEIAVLEGHTWATAVAFSPDGKMLASGRRDGTIMLWGVKQPSPDVAVEPEGKRLTTLGGFKDTMLLQNYPNPFNPDTWIPFELANESDVILRIYDAKGRLVREISFLRKPAGSYIQKEYAIHWDGKNKSGERVTSGVYFYTLQTGDFKKTKKMTVAK